jgi:hypothetical protein
VNVEAEATILESSSLNASMPFSSSCRWECAEGQPMRWLHALR